MSKIVSSGRSKMNMADKECPEEQTDVLADVLGKAVSPERNGTTPQVGKIVDINNEGRIMVDCPAYFRGPVQARLTSTVRNRIVQQNLRSQQEVLLVFENGRPEYPIIIDTLHTTTAETKDVQTLDVAVGMPQEVTVDGKRISFNALEEVVLRCGAASITLTSEGRVIIRGAHVVSRSTGANKIKGGSVQIN